MANSKFQGGRLGTTFTCGCCGKRTRQVMEDGTDANLDLCADCVYEAETENSHFDGYHDTDQEGSQDDCYLCAGAEAEGGKCMKNFTAPTVTPQETAVQETTQETAPAGEYATEIERLRDGQQLSWAKVAKEMGLASPGAARKAYLTHTGRPHTTSVLAGKPVRQPSDRPKADRPKKEAKGAKVAGVTKKQAAATQATAPANAVFSADTPDEEVAATIRNHTVIVRFTVPGLTRTVVDEHFVAKVTAFGISVKSGVKWVRFNDKDQKSRTVALDNIVGVR